MNTGGSEEDVVLRSGAPRAIRGALIAGTALLLLAIGADGLPTRPRSFLRASASAWAWPVHEAVIFSATLLDADHMPADRAPSLGGLRSAAGSPVLIATMVHARVLAEIAISRIGGLYGP